MTIQKYCKEDEPCLFDLIKEEGEEWIDYHGELGRNKYTRALETSVVYVAYDGDVLCGYARCREDSGFGLYVYDLLVKKSYRGRQLGKMLVAQAAADYAQQPVYVMSDVDPYYEKQGYQRVGSIFEVV